MLIFWWVSLLVLLAGTIVTLIVVWRSKRTLSTVPVAHLWRVTSLPEFASAKKRGLLRALAAATVLIVACTTTLVGIARPATQQNLDPTRYSRDVVLCLDVSGSMLTYDAALIDSYVAMLDKFDGERIALSLFNSSAVTVFPLTDDYDALREIMLEVREGLSRSSTGGLRYFRGTTDRSAAGSSLIGDGLASCTQVFDQKDKKRSRSIVFATDNMLAGSPIYTLPEATELAKKQSIRVYSLSPRGFSSRGVSGLQDTSKQTGGEQFTMSDAGSVSSIVDAIVKQEAEEHSSSPVTVTHDAPVIPLVLTFLAVAAFLILAWRLKR